MRQLLFSFFFLSFLLSFGQTAPEVPTWIGAPDFQKSPNQWFYLRKTFELEEMPTASSLKISADSKYWLWINGALVVNEGQLKRGPTPEDTYFDQLENSPHFKKGSNTIAVLV